MILCKKVFPSSTLALSSIIPAKGRHNLNNAIAPSNSNLHKACQLLDVAIIDNTSSFVAPSGAPRLALYRDPFHPSVQGTAKLAVSMKKMLANWQPDHFWRSDPGRSDRRNWPQANHHASLLPAQDSAIREQIIFLTTLFYLLAFSGSQYKPVEFFTAMSPSLGSGGATSASSSSSPSTTGSRFGQAVEQAISGVFMASLKMSAFYGLWTWLIHLVFGLDIVFIPSALAAVFAAIPFVGAYWACIPGVVDLWLVQGQSLGAVGFFLAHMIPAYIVDTAIYSEIKE
ncbi:hypothetical protein ACOMHN_025237 [Nucella lapillus]